MFRKKKKEKIDLFPPETWKPAVRSSICTGEKVAGFVNRNTDKFHEVFMIRSNNDLVEFCRTYEVDAASISTIY